MTVTLHTEPSVSPPEFSIICRTEGGPATYVVWVGPNGNVKEDSDHETSQIIVDTSNNSVYENRLRMRGKTSGIYTCFIESNGYQHTEGINYGSHQTWVILSLAM